MMGGSRGDPSPQVAALATLVEIADLLRNADKILPAGVAELREDAAAAKTAHAELDKAVAEHDARDAALTARGKALDQAVAAVISREAACQDREAATARKQGAFDEMDAKFAVWAQDLNQRTQALAEGQAALDADKLRHAIDHEAKAKALSEEATGRGLESQAAIRAERAKATAEIDQMRATVIADIAAQREQVDRDAAKLSAREEAFHSERNRLSALLKE